MSFKFINRFKRNKSPETYKNVTCANCETQFDGKFCPNCGQSIKDYDKPFYFVFYNFLGDFFAFDTRFFRSIGALLFKPGFLSKEYIEGRRVRYSPPFRIFVFVSFVLFLMLQNYTNKGLTTVLDADITKNRTAADSLANVLISDTSVVKQGEIDSLITTLGGLDTTGLDDDLKLNLNLETFRDTRDLRQILAKFAVALEDKLEKEEDVEQRMKLREHIRLCRSPEQAMAKILEYFSWTFFLLLPLFALFLKLFYIRRKHNYMRHLIFSIHIHAFIYSIMVLIIGLYMTIPYNLETVTSLLILALPVYTVIAMKKFYQQSFRKTLVKFVLISFLYNIVFFVLVIGAIANALELI